MQPDPRFLRGPLGPFSAIRFRNVRSPTFTEFSNPLFKTSFIIRTVPIIGLIHAAMAFCSYHRMNSGMLQLTLIKMPVGISSDGSAAYPAFEDNKFGRQSSRIMELMFATLIKPCTRSYFDHARTVLVLVNMPSTKERCTSTL